MKEILSYYNDLITCMTLSTFKQCIQRKVKSGLKRSLLRRQDPTGDTNPVRNA